MNSKWIMVVNRIEARFFNRREMRLVGRLNNSLGREKNRAFTTDRPSLGRNRTAARFSTHNVNEKHPHDDAAFAFARRVSQYLDRKMVTDGFDRISVYAEPRMMGWIKKQMNPKLANRCEWLPKDLGKLKPHELKEFLGAY